MFTDVHVPLRVDTSLHSVHALHSLTPATYETHGVSLHRFVDAGACDGQSLLAFVDAAPVATLTHATLRVDISSPQFAVHADHCDVAVQRNPDAHGEVLHAEVVVGTVTPLHLFEVVGVCVAMSTHTTNRCCVPPPHDTEHAPKSLTCHS